MIKHVVLYLFFYLCLTGCTGQTRTKPAVPTTDNVEMFGKLTELVKAEGQIDSILVCQNNKIIFEYHKTIDDASRIYNYNSVAKSITSLIAGIAIDNGCIKNEDELISDYFPEISKENSDKKLIKIRHLLSMTSGISWPESTAWNHFFRPMINSDNWINFIIGREMSEAPGKSFNYNSGNHHLVSKIIQDSTRQNMFDYGKSGLFDKLGMDSVTWYFDPQGVCFGGAWIQMSAADALKIGQLVLNKGTYKDQRIVSREWIEKMTSVQSPGYRWNEYVGGEYGYGWWINRFYEKETFFAWGANEQYIFVTPELNLVAVFNSTFSNQKATRPPYIFAEYIVKGLID